MASIDTALATVTQGIASYLPDIDVSEHPGRFTEDELGRTLTKQQAVRVAIERINNFNAQGNGIVEAEIQFAAFVICADKRGEDRHKTALVLIEKLAGLVTYARWDRPETFRAAIPDEIAIDNLYSGPLSNGKGIAMWVVTWNQKIRATN